MTRCYAIGTTSRTQIEVWKKIYQHIDNNKQIALVVFIVEKPLVKIISRTKKNCFLASSFFYKEIFIFLLKKSSLFFLICIKLYARRTGISEKMSFCLKHIKHLLYLLTIVVAIRKCQLFKYWLFIIAWLWAFFVCVSVFLTKSKSYFICHSFCFFDGLVNFGPLNETKKELFVFYIFMTAESRPDLRRWVDPQAP